MFQCSSNIVFIDPVGSVQHSPNLLAVLDWNQNQTFDYFIVLDFALNDVK